MIDTIGIENKKKSVIPELDNFRKKYPMYGDLSDSVIADKLAKKYPNAYGDLPGKLTPIEPIKYDPSNPEQRNQFIKEEGIPIPKKDLAPDFLTKQTPLQLVDTSVQPSSTGTNKNIQPTNPELVRKLTEAVNTEGQQPATFGVKPPEPINMQGSPFATKENVPNELGYTKEEQSQISQSLGRDVENQKPLLQKGAEAVYKSFEDAIMPLNKSVANPNANVFEKALDFGMALGHTGLAGVMLPSTFVTPASEKIGDFVGEQTGNKNLGKAIGGFLPFLAFGPEALPLYGAAKTSEYATKDILEVLNSSDLSEANKQRFASAIGLGSFILAHRLIHSGQKKILDTDLKNFIDKSIKDTGLTEKELNDKVTESMRPEGKRNIPLDENGVPKVIEPSETMPVEGLTNETVINPKKLAVQQAMAKAEEVKQRNAENQIEPIPITDFDKPMNVELNKVQESPINTEGLTPEQMKIVERVQGQNPTRAAEYALRFKNENKATEPPKEISKPEAKGNEEVKPEITPVTPEVATDTKQTPKEVVTQPQPKEVTTPNIKGDTDKYGITKEQYDSVKDLTGEALSKRVKEIGNGDINKELILNNQIALYRAFGQEPFAEKNPTPTKVEKSVNERTNKEIFEAKAEIQKTMPKPASEMTWEEYKPYGIKIVEQSAWGQPDKWLESQAKSNWDFAQENKKIADREWDNANPVSKVEKQPYELAYRSKRLTYPDHKKNDSFNVDGKELKIVDISKEGYKLSVDGEIVKSRFPKGMVDDYWQIDKIQKAQAEGKNIPKDVIESLPDQFQKLSSPEIPVKAEKQPEIKGEDKGITETKSPDNKQLIDEKPDSRYAETKDWADWIKKAPKDEVSFPDFKRALTSEWTDKTNSEISYYFDGKKLGTFVSDLNTTGIRDYYNKWVAGEKELPNKTDIISPDNNKAAAIRMFGEGKTRKQVRESLKLPATEENINLVESWKKESRKVKPSEIDLPFDKEKKVEEVITETKDANKESDISLKDQQKFLNDEVDKIIEKLKKHKDFDKEYFDSLVKEGGEKKALEYFASQRDVKIDDKFKLDIPGDGEVTFNGASLSQMLDLKKRIKGLTGKADLEKSRTHGENRNYAPEEFQTVKEYENAVKENDTNLAEATANKNKGLIETFTNRKAGLKKVNVDNIVEGEKYKEAIENPVMLKRIQKNPDIYTDNGEPNQYKINNDYDLLKEFKQENNKDVNWNALGVAKEIKNYYDGDIQKYKTELETSLESNKERVKIFLRQDGRVKASLGKGEFRDYSNTSRDISKAENDTYALNHNLTDIENLLGKETKKVEQPKTQLKTGTDYYTQLKKELGEKADIYPAWLKMMVKDYGSDFRKGARGFWKQVKEEAAKPVEEGKKITSESPKRLVSEEAYSKASDNLKKNLGNLNVGIDPTALKDLATVGAYHFENGLRTFSDWSKKMIEEFGEKIKPHLKKLWDQSREDYDLVALHNLTQENLVFADRVGGLAMPSIAITRRDLGLNKYGDISLVADKDLINPKYNKVYGRDIYSPTYPTIYRYVDKKEAYKVLDEVNKALPDEITQNFNDRHDIVDKIEKGYYVPSSIGESSELLKAYYLEKTKQLPDLLMKDEPLGSRDLPEFKGMYKSAKKVAEKYPILTEDYKPNNETIKKYADEIKKTATNDYYKTDEGAIESAKEKAYDEYVEQRDKVAWKFRDDMVKEFINTFKNDPTLQNHFKKLYDRPHYKFDGYGLLKDIDKLLHPKKVLDWYNYKYDKIEPLIKAQKEKYQKFIEQEFSNVFGSEYLLDGKRKIPHTLDNAVSIMGSNIRGAEKTIVQGLGKSATKSARKFTSLEQMENYKDNLISHQEFQIAEDKMRKGFDDLANSLYSYYPDREFGFDRLDNLSKAVGNLATKLNISDSMVRSELSRAGYKDVPTHYFDDAKAVARSMRDMPTEYFEVKKERVVGLGEFKGAVIPKDASPKIKKMLQDYGIKEIKTYERDNEQSRLEAVNKLEQTRFGRIITKDAYENALQRRREVGNKLLDATSLPGETAKALKDFSVIGAYHLENGIRDFSRWSKEMINDLGEQVKPHLDKLWNDLKAKYPEIEKGYTKAELPKAELPKTETTKDIPESGETKVRGLAKRTEAEAIAKGITKGLNNLPEYDVKKNQPRIEQAADIIANDIERAKRIVRGEETIADETLQGFIYEGLKEYAVKNNDFKLVKDLATEDVVSAKGTQYGQFIQSLRDSDPNSPVKAIKDIIKAREDARANKLDTRRAQDYERRIKNLEDKIAEKDDLIKKAEADKAIRKIKRETDFRARRAGRKRSVQEIDKHLDSLVQQFAKTIKPHTGIDPVQVKLMVEMAKDYVEKGIIKAEDVVDAIHTTLSQYADDLTPRDIRDAISGYGKETRKTRTELQKNISDLRRQMQLISKIEDLEAGKIPFKKTINKTEPTETLSNLKDKLKAEMKTSEVIQGENLAKSKENIRNRIKEIYNKINQGDYSKQEKTLPATDKEKEKLQKDLDFIRGRYKDIQKNLGELISDEEAKVITDLAQKTTEAKLLMEGSTRRELLKPATAEELEYGRARVAFKEYVDQLKESANKVTLQDFKDKPFSTIGNALKHVPGITKSAKATLDNSGLFNQHIKTLWTHPSIWLRNARNSFSDIAKTFGGKNVLHEISADIVSRPNYENYRKDGLAVSVIEEAFPDSKLLESIPFLGRVHKAADTAFTGLAYRNRADLYDLYTEIAKQNGNVETIGLGIGKLANSLTGRGNLGGFERSADTFNVLFFSPRYVKSHFDVLTAHVFDKDVSPFVKRQAAINLMKIVGGTAAVMLSAKAMGADVELDPRSADFGSIKVGNTRFHIMGGMNSLVTLASRIITLSSKSTTTGKVNTLNSGRYGSQTGWDVINNFAQGKLSPVAGVARDLLKGQTYGGERPTLGNELQNLTVPLPITNWQEFMNDPKSANIIAGTIADGLGIFTSTYSNDPDLRKVTNTLLRADKEKLRYETKSNFYNSVDAALKNGSITQKQADQYKEQFQELQKDAPPAISDSEDPAHDVKADIKDLTSEIKDKSIAGEPVKELSKQLTEKYKELAKIMKTKDYRDYLDKKYKEKAEKLKGKR